ncbi:site-specific integrase [Paraflavitalea sp. CAU 1676]|uniref:site-specific integrase n=1 Tax=Paraflavitalea sp. CAU 1676 TaxID=3032598 RepID=UPI0023DB672E|nr:site-specific integrase [Paraflavitalea sp. CAU 1676]MDF2189819.1 site-specific integrase [Paraflavitalea sp. CAU 1676]
MKLPIKLICRKNKLNGDGTTTVFIQYCYDADHKTLLHTGIKIPPLYWNKAQGSISNKLPVEFGNADSLNKELWRQLRVVESLATHAIQTKMDNKGEFVKKTFHPDMHAVTVEERISEAAKREVEAKRSKLDIYFQFDEYIKSKQRKVGKATLTVYGNVKSHLLAFQEYRQKKITFGCLDFSFYEDFVDYLTFEHVHMRRQTEITGLKLNTIGKTIKHLRGFIKDRVKRKISAPIDLTDFKIPEEDSDAIYLTHEEIGTIYQTDLSDQPHLVEYRDLFVLACLTGLRFSDFSTLKPEDLQRDMLYKKQEKSDHWVIIPLREEAKQIFTRQFRDRIPALTNPEFNRHIKTIGRLAGITRLVKFSYKRGNQNVVVTRAKYDWITSHTARRSFCTNEFLAGTPVELIMKISGHKRTKDFYKYIRITPEEAANRIKELWLARDDMKLIKEKVEKGRNGDLRAAILRQ